MTQYWKPIAALLILSTLLTELLSGNTSLAALVQPATLVLFMTIGYGFPVLILREIWVRKQFGLLQMFLLGIGYGIYNEGLYARTIFNPYHSPVESMATYGLLDDVRIPWLLSIGTWHALFAVIFPIVLVHVFFPRQATQSWIGTKTAWVLGVLGVGVGMWQFLAVPAAQRPDNIAELAFMFACVGALWALSALLPARPTVAGTQHSHPWRYFFVGVLLFACLYVVPIVLSGMQVPVWAYLLYFAVALGIFGYGVLRHQTMSLSHLWYVALGGEVACASVALLLAWIMGNTVLMSTSVLFVAIFLSLMWWRRV